MADVVPFGKYRGRPVGEMLSDASYMEWLEAQPWFRERYGHLVRQRDALDLTESTPEHNRLQALFLDPTYCTAFLRVINAGEDRIEKAISSVSSERAVATRMISTMRSGKRTYGSGIDEWMAAEAALQDSSISFLPPSAAFERDGADVLIKTTLTYPVMTWTGYGSEEYARDVTVCFREEVFSVSIEIKPSVADDFPVVLRQMNHTRSRNLFLESYVGAGVSEKQFVGMFAASGKRVVFKRDVDAEFAKLGSAA